LLSYILRLWTGLCRIQIKPFKALLWLLILHVLVKSYFY
jgi:hypothetical protein